MKHYGPFLMSKPSTSSSLSGSDIKFEFTHFMLYSLPAAVLGVLSCKHVNAKHSCNGDYHACR